MLTCDVDRESIVENLGGCKEPSVRILCQIGKLRAVISEGLHEDVVEVASYPTWSAARDATRRQ